MNPSQKIPTFQRGQALPADALNHIVEAVKRMIVAGAGIRIERAGDQITIHAKGQPMSGGGGGGGASGVFYSAPTKAELPSEPNLYKFGRVDGVGADNGMVCVVNPDHNGWDALNFFE